MNGRAPGDSLACELRDLNVALEDQWRRRFRCPICGLVCRPDLVRGPHTRVWQTKLTCRECGFTGQGELERPWAEVAL